MSAGNGGKSELKAQDIPELEIKVLRPREEEKKKKGGFLAGLAGRLAANPVGMLPYLKLAGVALVGLGAVSGALHIHGARTQAARIKLHRSGLGGIPTHESASGSGGGAPVSALGFLKYANPNFKYGQEDASKAADASKTAAQASGQDSSAADKNKNGSSAAAAAANPAADMMAKVKAMMAAKGAGGPGAAGAGQPKASAMGQLSSGFGGGGGGLGGGAFGGGLGGGAGGGLAANSFGSLSGGLGGFGGHMGSSFQPLNLKKNGLAAAGKNGSAAGGLAALAGGPGGKLASALKSQMGGKLGALHAVSPHSLAATGPASASKGKGLAALSAVARSQQFAASSGQNGTAYQRGVQDFDGGRKAGAGGGGNPISGGGVSNGGGGLSGAGQVGIVNPGGGATGGMGGMPTDGGGMGNTGLGTSFCGSSDIKSCLGNGVDTQNTESKAMTNAGLAILAAVPLLWGLSAAYKVATAGGPYTAWAWAGVVSACTGLAGAATALVWASVDLFKGGNWIMGTVYSLMAAAIGYEMTAIFTGLPGSDLFKDFQTALSTSGEVQQVTSMTQQASELTKPDPTKQAGQ